MDKKALILVVDDNTEYRELLVWILELHGFRTISAACGLEAVELAIEFQPRLVLMDLSMPGMNGFEATHGKPWEEKALLQIVTKVLARDSRAESTRAA